MGDESVQYTIVSNSSSRDTLVGLATENDALSSFPSTLVVPNNPSPTFPSAALAVPASPVVNTVPEFLYQLTKMLTGGHGDIIEWTNGRIEVHNPHRLESTVLHKYFRHSKFASFQRQLNYFGFRKLAGKGKMAPCSYVNEAATQDLGSLLLIKRKATTAPKDKNGRKHGAEKHPSSAVFVPLNTAQEVLHPPGTAAMPSTTFGNRAPAAFDQQTLPAPTTQQAIAQAAVGRGIRHCVGASFAGVAATEPLLANTRTASPKQHTQVLTPKGVEDCLSQLENNYRNSLLDERLCPEKVNSNTQGRLSPDRASTYYREDPFPALLSRNSSLVDLAMIATLDDGQGEEASAASGMKFVDFPQPEVDPSKYRLQEHY